MSDERMRHRGTCTLQFEGQEFLPEDAIEGQPQPRYWLTVSPTAKSQLSSLLEMDVSALQWAGPFEAEFWGAVAEFSEPCGHLGMYQGEAYIAEIISARLLHPLPGKPSGAGASIRQRLRDGAAQRQREGES